MAGRPGFDDLACDTIGRLEHERVPELVFRRFDERICALVRGRETSKQLRDVQPCRQVVDKEAFVERPFRAA